jgi:hypothetical protein
MGNQIYRGVVRGGLVVIHGENAPLVEGTEVVITPAAEFTGTSTAVMAAMNSQPKVPAEWVDEMEQFISDGQRISAA